MANKTADLPGMKPPRIAALDEAAEEYVKVRDRRMGLTEKEVQAKANLIDLLHKHADKIPPNDEGVMYYKYDDVVVELKPGKEQLKVRTATNPAGEERDTGPCRRGFWPALVSRRFPAAVDGVKRAKAASTRSKSRAQSMQIGRRREP
jgi:hypothetical protein